MVFYNDEELEKRFDSFIRQKAKSIMESRRTKAKIEKEDIVHFLRMKPDGLDRILNMVRISEEKFMRIVTLLRRLDGDFDTEWSTQKIKMKVKEDNVFADKIANLFRNGKNDPKLIKHLPLFYRERFNLKSLEEPYHSEEELVIKLKDQYQGTYSNWRGKAMENLIKRKIEAVGVTFDKGKTSLVDVSVDWTIPSLSDPYVLIMSSYQETTSSAQSTKARDMLTCFQAISRRNIQHRENRAFVNFVDGGGWLARQNDLRRLVEGCHYFLNIKNLDMLEGIIRKHIATFAKQTRC